MSLFHTANLTNDNLLLCYDIGNYKCFRGEATSNLITNGDLNAFPTFGNQWKTYQTNQFNNGVPISIGAIANITNNIVTTVSNHPLRTYDVMSPLSAGGGVSPAQVYFIKKISNTSFSLHEYNSSEDGSQGYINPSTNTYKVYDSIANDIRIPINITNFPTSWIGPSHLPNSTLVKEIIPGGFNVSPFPQTDCMRLHYTRTGVEKDGLYSSSLNLSLSNFSSNHVFSFYARAVDSKAVGKQISFLIFNYGTNASFQDNLTFRLGEIGQWYRYEFNHIPLHPSIFLYWFGSGTTDIYKWDIACIQIENKPKSTFFTSTSRGSTVSTRGGLKDLSNRNYNGELIFSSSNPGPSFSTNNKGCLYFDGIDDFVQIGSIGNPQRFSISFWVNPEELDVSPANNYRRIIVSDVSANFILIEENGAVNFRVPGVDVTSFATSSNLIQAKKWSNVVCVYDQNFRRIYVDGIFRAENQIGAGTVNLGPIKITDNSIQTFKGFLSELCIYSIPLSSIEIHQNFRVRKSRYSS